MYYYLYNNLYLSIPVSRFIRIFSNNSNNMQVIVRYAVGTKQVYIIKLAWCQSFSTSLMLASLIHLIFKQNKMSQMPMLQCLQILTPLQVAKLMTTAFPSFPDCFLVAQVVARDGTHRGLLTPDQLHKQERLWENVKPVTTRMFSTHSWSVWHMYTT